MVFLRIGQRYTVPARSIHMHWMFGRVTTLWQIWVSVNFDKFPDKDTPKQVKLCLQKNSLFIILIIPDNLKNYNILYNTRSCAALRAADLDWIVGPGYSSGRVHSWEKPWKTNLEPWQTNLEPWKTMKPPWKTTETNQKPLKTMKLPWETTETNQKP